MTVVVDTNKFGCYVVKCLVGFIWFPCRTFYTFKEAEVYASEMRSKK